MAPAPYPRAIAMATLQAALGSSWILAGELSPTRRRLTRLGIVATVGAIGYAASPKSSDAEVTPAVGVNPFPVAEGRPAGDTEPAPFDKRKAAVAAALLGASSAAIFARRRLEKRWLARLVRNGHPHPTRGLAVRMAGVEFVGQLALQLSDIRKARAASRQ